MVEWDEVDDSTTPTRGLGGWGSTGRSPRGRARVRPCLRRTAHSVSVSASPSAVAARSSPSSRARPRRSASRRSSSPTTSSTTTSRPRSRSRTRPRSPTTLRVGPFVLGNDYKHPVVLRARDGDARPALRRPARARHRRGLDDRRLREGRASRSTPPACGSHASPKSITVMKGLFAPGPFSFARRATTRSPTSTACRSPCSSRCRSASVAARRRSSDSRRARRRSSASTRTCGRATATRPTPRSR